MLKDIVLQRGWLRNTKPPRILVADRLYDNMTEFSHLRPVTNAERHICSISRIRDHPKLRRRKTWYDSISEGAVRHRFLLFLQLSMGSYSREREILR